MNNQLPQGFSIVVCTHNGQQRLEPTLEHLAALRVPQGHAVELIVVDNASTDNTKCLVQQTWAKLGMPFPLRLLEEPRPGKGYAVELGYDAAQYACILTVDDDNWLSPDYLLTAVALLQQHPDATILQGKSIGVFETPPPDWFAPLDYFFVVGGPIKGPGYFPPNDYRVWGAGMVLYTAHWKALRARGFAFLTSKQPGKAAGEDHETAIGLLLSGGRIYYSDQLTYRHYMPAERITWKSLKKGFGIWAFLTYHYFLYALVIDAYEKGQVLTKAHVDRKARKYILKSFRSHTPKQLLAYGIRPRDEFYQLRIYRDLQFCKWYFRLSKKAMQDISFLQRWMHPLLDENRVTLKLESFV